MTQLPTLKGPLPARPEGHRLCSFKMTAVSFCHNCCINSIYEFSKPYDCSHEGPWKVNSWVLWCSSHLVSWIDFSSVNWIGSLNQYRLWINQAQIKMWIKSFFKGIVRTLKEQSAVDAVQFCGCTRLCPYMSTMQSVWSLKACILNCLTCLSSRPEDLKGPVKDCQTKKQHL